MNLPVRIALVILLLSLRPAMAQERPLTQEAVVEQARRLDTKNDRAARLEALKWLNHRSRDRQASAAIPALEQCLRKDPDPEVRGQAVLNLGLIARNRDKACPLALIEAKLDPVDEVRWQATECVGMFKTFDPGSVDVLLRGARSEKAEVRSTCLLTLGLAAGKDRRALDVMEKAKTDRVLDVRNSAYRARFLANDRLDEFLPYLIRLREDADAVLAPVPANKEMQSQEQALRNLLVLGTATQLIEWSDRRADDLAAILVKLLEDRSPLMRRGAANIIGAVVIKVELPKPRITNFDPPAADGTTNTLLPLLDPKAAPSREKPPEWSKAGLKLQERKAVERLRELSEKDAEPEVRRAARNALERVARLDLRPKP